MNVIFWLLIGAIAGWIAGNIMRGGGFGLLGNIVVGIVGALVGGWVFGLMGIAAGGTLGSLVTAVVGACVLLFIVESRQARLTVARPASDTRRRWRGRRGDGWHARTSKSWQCDISRQNYTQYLISLDAPKVSGFATFHLR